jgi:Bifunctional DNA primase/polymerase, N-terminal/AAA domain
MSANQNMSAERIAWAGHATDAPITPGITPNPLEPIVEHAVHYATRNGWSVFPAPAGQKKSHKSAKHSGGRKWGMTTDADEIRRDFEQWPDANVGVVCGAVSGIFVVEADTMAGHGVDGIASLTALEAEHCALPDTLQAMSPSGSIHYYFKHPGFDIKNSASAIASGVDVRGDRGMVVAPPSVKPGNGAYTWRNNLPIADAPQWLLERIIAGKEEPEPDEESEPELSISQRAAALVRPPGGPIDLNPFTTHGFAASHKSSLFDHGREYIDAAVKGEYDEVARAPKGKRNDQLNDSSLKLGHYVGGGVLDEKKVIDTMMDACAANGSLKEDGRAACLATIESGLTKGKTEPKGIPEKKNNVTQLPGTTPTSDPVKPGPYIVSSAGFLAGFVPPDYLIDGILQRRFCYSITAQTGTGKTAMALLFAVKVAHGHSLGEIGVEKGRVLYLAGENPDDIRMRWLASAERLGFDPDAIDVSFLPGVFKISEIYPAVHAEVEKIGEVALVVVDTSAAYYEGADENDNVQMGAHARLLRRLVNLPGQPCVLVCCHPVKNATADNMVPKGGGSFLNEVDGNLTLSKTDSVVTLHWFGKFRGPDFAPLPFELHTVTTEKLKDSKGRLIPSVVATPLSEKERGEAQSKSRKDEDDVLLTLARDSRRSLADLALLFNWTTKDGKPNRAKAQRVTDRLKRNKLVKVERDAFILTTAGKKEADRLKEL